MLPNYSVGGIHSESAALRNTLAHAGIVAPHTGQPFSEAMVLGLGGGLGAGYILWEFKEHKARVLVLGFHKNWQYTQRFLEDAAGRAGATLDVKESGGAKGAAKLLDESLAAGRPAITWMDRAHLPYYQLPASLSGHMGQLVVTIGRDGSEYLVDDLAAVPFRVDAETYTAGRGRISSYKNRLAWVNQGEAPADFPANVLSALHDQIAHLSQPSDSFSLPAWRKWGRLMTDRKNAKAWPKVFADRESLYGALKSAYENIELIGTGGGGLRGLYADFLDEAAPVVDRPALKDVAGRYRALAAQWSELATAALPDDLEPLAETRRLLRQRRENLMAKGDDAAAENAPLTERLGALHKQHNRAFPADDARVEQLFRDMGDRLLAIYDEEVKTLAALKEAVGD